MFSGRVVGWHLFGMHRHGRVLFLYSSRVVLLLLSLFFSRFRVAIEKYHMVGFERVPAVSLVSSASAVGF